jgi:integrase
MRHAADDRHGWRVRAMIVVLWRAGLRIQEALALAEHDLDPRRGSLLIRNGKGGRRREVGMDQWGWEQLRPWLNARPELPVGPLLCIIDGPTRGRPWSGAAVRSEFRRLASSAGVRRRFAPHQLRHAHALELAREGVPLNIIQHQLGHANLGTTSIYLQGIDPDEIIATVHMRRAPMMSRQRGASALVENRLLRAGAPRRSRSALTKRASDRDGRDQWSSSTGAASSACAGAPALPAKEQRESPSGCQRRSRTRR